MSFKILGTGSSLPALRVTNDDLSKKVDTSDEWIVSKTGIKERRILSSESLTDIATDACVKALESANAKIEDIDLIICATTLGDMYIPSMACLVAEKLGAKVPSFDVNAACSGFVYALDVAAGYFARKKVKKVLVVSAEQLSKHVNWQDRTTCVLFGDGAAAVVLGEGNNLLAIRLTCVPDSTALYANYTGGVSPFDTREKLSPYINMNGQAVYRFAVNAACNDLTAVIKEANLNENDISHILLHQANMRIIDAAIAHIKIPKDKFINSIDRTGNVSAVSIPLLLDEANKAKKFKKGDLLAISAFGAGLTTGACVIRW